MALSVAVGSFNISTGVATTTQEINISPAFQPKAIIFWWGGETSATDAATGQTHSRGIGFAVSTSQRYSIATRSVDAAASGDTQNRQDAAECICTIAADLSLEGAADLSSMDVDGFTLVIDDQFPAAYRIHYIALGGTDITNAAAGTFAMTAATGNQDVAVGFDPSIVFFISSPGSGAFPRTSIGEGFSFGAMTATGEQVVIMGNSRDGSANMATRHYANDIECIAVCTSANALSSRHAYAASWPSNNFTVNRLEGTLTYNVFYLAIAGGQWDIGTATTQTDTTTAITCTTGFQTNGAIILSTCAAESTQDTLDNDDRWSVGAFQSTSSRGAHAILDETSVADAVVTTAVEHDEVYINIAAGGAVQGLMDVSSIGSTSFNMIMDDADPTGVPFWWIACGVAVSGSLVIPRKSKTYIRR